MPGVVIQPGYVLAAPSQSGDPMYLEDEKGVKIPCKLPVCTHPSTFFTVAQTLASISGLETESLGCELQGNDPLTATRKVRFVRPRSA